jgi:hypothetical protein
MSTSPVVSENEIRTLAESKISQVCNEHGVTRDDLKQEVITDAYKWSKEKLEADKQRAADPYYQENLRLREELRIARMQTEAIKAGRVNVGNDTRPAIDVNTARARLGEFEWNVKLTDAGRLQAIGVDPSTVTAATRAEILELFGPKASSARACDLMKANAGRYRQLKEIGRALRII